jgi:PAS domain-containing protein
MSSDLVRVNRLSGELDVKGEQLRGSEQRLALAADAAGAGLWSIDRETGRLWATSRALSMFGLAPDREHHYDDLLRSIHPDDRERVRKALRPMASSASPTQN